MPDKLKEAIEIICKHCYLEPYCWCDTCIITKIKEYNTQEEEEE